MRMICERTMRFLRDQTAAHIAEFLDDPDGMCQNNPHEIARHYDLLCIVCQDCGLDFWEVVKQEKRSSSEIERLEKYLEQATEPGDEK